MKRVVVDASVAVKWVFPDAPDEPNVREALGLLGQIRDGGMTVVQPAHWLAEVLAVVVRIAPEVAREASGLLYAMDLEISDGPEVYQAAVELSSSLGHHLFDTLYHAVALCDGEAELVTADERYFRKAQHCGRIRLLEGYSQ